MWPLLHILLPNSKSIDQSFVSPNKHYKCEYIILSIGQDNKDYGITSSCPDTKLDNNNNNKPKKEPQITELSGHWNLVYC